MMNPMQLIQMMRGGNPQQFLQQMMGNNSVMSNPMARNAMQMAQKGDYKGIEQMARNLCQEKGLNPDDIIKQIKSGFGI
jgi:ABC-type microcin C transport system permease subunit YejB